MTLPKLSLVLASVVALLVGLFVVSNDTQAAPAPAPVVALAPLTQGGGTPPPEECEEWCSHFGTIPCPEWTCDGIMDMNCYNAACTAWNNAVTACYTAACDACKDEHDKHALNNQAIQDAYEQCRTACGSDTACAAACATTRDTSLAAEKTRHDRKLAKIGSDFADCQQAATTTYYNAVAACCH